MKLLLVAPHFPYPPRSGSALIAYYYLKHLSQRHTVDLIAFKDDPTAEPGDLAAWCRHTELLEPPARWQVRLKLLAGIVGDLPLAVSHYLSWRTAATIRQWLEHHTYDAVLFQLTEMAQFLPRGYQGAAVLCLEDPLVLKYQRRSPWRLTWYTRWLNRYEIGRIRRYEQRHAPCFDRVLLLNPNDVADYQAIFRGVRFDWVPYGVDVDLFSPSDSVARQDGMIVLSGNMNHPPNVDAVTFFCRDVFPLVRAQVPTATLWLVGANPVPEVMQWAADSQINVTGFVPDVKDYLRRALVSVCPMAVKTGSQTKILEALACGTPVVATSAANNGIGAVSGEHLYLADDPAAFAGHVVSLLNRQHWDRLSQDGRRFVVENFAWERCVTRLEHILGAVVQEVQARAVAA